MKDVSSWPIIGYGENSTLEKFEIVSPDGTQYVMKFPRPFDGKRTNWEDLNEVIASKVASMLDLLSVSAEVAYYKGDRGCLMKNFAQQFNAEDRETVASLMAAQFEGEYEHLHLSKLPNVERMKAFLVLFEQFKHYNVLKETFVNMNLFDILIGN
ncbi:hypothetical protein JMA_35440 [Jeotgalibacillus malaysiensis]|uniref:Aminoglycoside phosphotransferase domain-containing protein n=1 Tax=Jeotgalibacillus malaysiensis TaxID=1508404 RepID=A0A0B5AS32_9BACL|nr:hypothetical protein [Jeotgalibacillus malaysiensis]AJD92861.1 hypothetical protein JMA_35440 [Jeotgalibacillus malaysiensis]